MLMKFNIINVGGVSVESSTRIHLHIHTLSFTLNSDFTMQNDLQLIQDCFWFQSRHWGTSIVKTGLSCHLETICDQTVKELAFSQREKTMGKLQLCYDHFANKGSQGNCPFYEWNIDYLRWLLVKSVQP